MGKMLFRYYSDLNNEQARGKKCLFAFGVIFNANILFEGTGMKNLIVWLNSIINKHKALKRWRRVVTVLAAIMTFVTTYALILPAITVEKNKVEDVGGMYLEQEADTNDMLEENALEPIGVSIAA